MKHTINFLKIKLAVLFFAFLFFQSCPNGKAVKTISSIDQKYLYTKEGKKIKLPAEKDTTTTTFILVRHAEKGVNGKDPDLTPDGLQRADDLAEILKQIEVSHVFSTDYIRTKDTARPTAVDKGLPLDIYNPSNQNSLLGHMVMDPDYKNVLLVGHSNSIPAALNHLLATSVYENIDHEEYDNIYFVRTSDGEKTKLISLKY